MTDALRYLIVCTLLALAVVSIMNREKSNELNPVETLLAQ